MSTGSRRAILWFAITGVATACLVACAGKPVRPPSMPLLRLSPAQLSATLALQQKLTITSRGQIREVELLLEADAQAVRLAAVDLGQTAVRLEWDGTTLTQSRAPWWPEAISSERILSDLQLMLWPAAAIAAALPAGWALETDAAGRTLNHQGMPVARVSWLGKTVSELDHYVDGYRIRVESRAVEGSP